MSEENTSVIRRKVVRALLKLARRVSTPHSQAAETNSIPALDITAKQPAHASEPEEHGTFPFRFSDLPLEIFQQILLYCAAPSKDRDSPPHQRVSPEWLPITQVCHSWRDITQSYPPLWTTITPDLNSFWIDIMYEQSKPLLLDVDFHFGLGHISDRQRTKTAYNARLILRKVSHRMRSLRLDGPSDLAVYALSNNLTASQIMSLSLRVNLPWDCMEQINIPNNTFASNAPLRSLPFLAGGVLHAPDWLFQGLTSFETDGDVPLWGLLDALRQMPVLEFFTLFTCSVVWIENDIFTGDPIPMDRLKEFTVRTDTSPQHFVPLAMHLAIPDTARMRLAVNMPAEPEFRCLRLIRVLQELPSLHAFYTRGGLQNVHISGGPTRGRFLAWTDEPHDDTARFCFELEWYTYPSDFNQIPVYRLSIPFRYLGVFCAQLNAVGVRRVLVEGDPAHIHVATGLWHRFFARLPNVEELWLYPGTAEVIWSACRTPDAEPVLQSLKRVYVVEGRLSAESPKPSKPNITSDPRGVLSGLDLNGPPSPPLGNRREEVHSLDVRPGLMALLRGGVAFSMEVHLRNCEVEDGALAPLCALAKVWVDYGWILQ